jgi:hypothetical protein
MSSEDPFGGLFGDPDELRRRMEEFAQQMQGAQKVAWADNAIKLAVDMTVAGINRLNLQGNAEQQVQDLRARCSRCSPRPSSWSRGSRGLRDVAPLLPVRARIDLLEAPVAEDEHERGEADAEGERADRDLLAHRVGRHGGARRRAREHLREQRLLHAAPCGVNGTAAETAFTPSTSSTFLTEPPTLKASSSIQNAAKRKHQPPSCTRNTSRK